MKEAILEVENYFKEKMLNGEFEIVERGECTYEICIDNDYYFNVWVANKKDNRNIYKSERNYINFEFKTLKERHKLNKWFWRDYKEYMDNIHKKDIKKQIAALEAKL